MYSNTMSNWDWTLNQNFPLCTCNGETLWIRPDDRIEFEGNTYIYFNDLPDDVREELSSQLSESSGLSIIGNMIIQNYLVLASNSKIQDVTTNIEKDKRIFVTYNDKLYYVVDYDSLR